MTVGTKSVLFGAHCFCIHPWFVAAAWWKLFGFPWDPRLWVSFFVHDIGYWGKPNMDGPEGEEHPRVGANIMYHLFGMHWWSFCMFHSRFLAKKYGEKHSRLCTADKLAICLTPAWLYLPAVRLTGEINEYMKLARDVTETNAGKYSTMNIRTDSQRLWYRDVQNYLRTWVEEHRDGRLDNWTPTQKKARSESGAWQ